MTSTFTASATFLALLTLIVCYYSSSTACFVLANTNNEPYNDPANEQLLKEGEQPDDFSWLHFDCQVCSALCTELDKCVRATHIDHPHQEIVRCAVDNVTEYYGMDPSATYLRRRSDGAEGRKEKMTEDRHAAIKEREEQERRGSSSSSSLLSRKKISERITKSLETHMDIYHHEVVLQSLVAAGKGRLTRHKVPHDMCFEILCHEHLHVCHRDEHPPHRHHDIDQHVDQLLEAERRKQKKKTKTQTRSKSMSKSDGENNNDNDEDDDENGDQYDHLLKTHHDKDKKFATHHDHHHSYKDQFHHFVRHFEDYHFGGRENSRGRLSSQQRSHHGSGGKHVHPHVRRHAAYMKTPDERKAEDAERVRRTTEGGGENMMMMEEDEDKN